MALNLFQASKQWATRPDDERFWTLREMYEQCRGYAGLARQATVNVNALQVSASDAGDLQLSGDEGRPAKFTHWAFGQLCSRVGAPAGYLRELPAPMAASCLDYGLRRIGSDGAAESKVLFHANGDLVCRSFTSDDYARIWNWEVIERLLQLAALGWRVPPARPARENQNGARPATEADILPNQGDFGLRVKVGDVIAPAGLYASDHDMFAFLVNESARIDDGSPCGLARGVFVTNSEVGAASLKVTRFLYRHVCGNHIVWDAKDVKELRIVHRGRNDHRFGFQMEAELRMYAEESASDDEARVKSAKRCSLGGNKDEVIDKLFGLRILPRKRLEQAYDYAEREADQRLDVSPRSAWGFAQGITAMSQKEAYADARVELDRAAGKVLSIAF